LLAARIMVIRRCAWHQTYRGYRVIYGVADWRGWGFSFSDGLCRQCALSLRHDLYGRPVPPPRWRVDLGPAPELAPLALGLVAVVAAVIAVRPLDLPRPSASPVGLPATVSIPAPEEPAPALARLRDDALERLFAPLADLEVEEAPAALAAQPKAPERPDVAVAAAPWSVRPRLLSLITSGPDVSTPPSRALLAFVDDPSNPRANATVQAP
jgi:hypothetical protein